jgi:hypothetical protein
MGKLFWLQGYRQLKLITKLITTLHQDTKSTGYLNACGTAAPIISPGQEHELTLVRIWWRYYWKTALQ